jgi:hypothetical protein
LTLAMVLGLAITAQAAVSFVLATVERTALANVLNTDLASGSIKIYVSNGGTLLATVPLKATTIGTVSNGVITIDCTSTTATAAASGTATYATLCNSGGTELANCNVGTATTTIILNTNVIVSGGPVTITAGTLTVPAGS